MDLHLIQSWNKAFFSIRTSGLFPIAHPSLSSFTIASTHIKILISSSSLTLCCTKPIAQSSYYTPVSVSAPACPVPVAVAGKSHRLVGGNVRDSLILGERRHPHQLLLALLKHSSIPRRSQEDLRLLRGLLVAYRAEHSGSVKTSYVVRGASGIRGTSLGLVRSPRGCLAAKWSAMFCSALEDTFLLCQEQKLMKDIDSFIKWM